MFIYMPFFCGEVSSEIFFNPGIYTLDNVFDANSWKLVVEIWNLCLYP